MADPKFHFFHLSFVIQDVGTTRFFSHQVQAAKKDISMQVLSSIRAALGVPQNAEVLSISYLGQMTRNEFAPPARAGMEATKEFTDGLMVGMGHKPMIDNPHQVGTVEHEDWRNGRMQGTELLEQVTAATVPVGE